MPRFTTLYSGSSGNAGVVEKDGNFLLVDMGASCKATLAGLAALDLNPANLQGILVTHEHIDHIRGIKVFLKRHPVPVYASHATLGELWHKNAVLETTELIAIDGHSEDVGGFVVDGFDTSHDSAGCCGFRIKTAGSGAMAIATDLGVVTPDVFDKLCDADLVALEANYDPESLRLGMYPYYLKQRIQSSNGHLSNGESALTIAALAKRGCERFALCHLSQENNRPELAMQAMENAFFGTGVNLPNKGVLQVCKRHEVSPWIDF